VSFINTERALDHQRTILKTFDVGLFPRQWALCAGGTMLLSTEFGSSRLDVFDVPALLQGDHEGGSGVDPGRINLSRRWQSR
jgi:hypothetical protein